MPAHGASTPCFAPQAFIEPPPGVAHRYRNDSARSVFICGKTTFAAAGT
jgi:hypothetical protein